MTEMRLNFNVHGDVFGFVNSWVVLGFSTTDDLQVIIN